MGRTHDAEVAPVQRRDRIDPETFGRGDDGGVDGSEGQITVCRDEFGDADPIAGQDRIGGEGSCREISEESHFGLGPDPLFDEVGDLGDHELWNDQGARVGKQERKARAVIAVILIDVGVKRA